MRSVVWPLIVERVTPLSSVSSAVIRALAAVRSACEAVCLNVEPAGQVLPDVGVVIAAPPADGTHIAIGLSAAATPVPAITPSANVDAAKLTRQPAITDL